MMEDSRERKQILETLKAEMSKIKRDAEDARKCIEERKTADTKARRSNRRGDDHDLIMRFFKDQIEHSSGLGGDVARLFKSKGLVGGKKTRRSRVRLQKKKKSGK